MEEQETVKRGPLFRAQYAGNVSKMKHDLEDALFASLDNAEKRIWSRVILEAVNDLKCHKKVKLKDDNEQTVYDEKGSPIYTTVRQNAIDFLSNKTKSLGYICRYLDLNLHVIKRIVENEKYATI